ncbi:MAG: RNA polymerase sigma factor, partial [Chloroflexi bacterium]|nr:RNA polymerase sigma factor [Chloroflexota bacterium]
MAERARRDTRIGPAIDRSLIDRARNGDVEAFEAIVRARMDAMYRLTSAILGSEADARDAAQETFVAAWRQIGRLRDPDKFEAWLQRVAVNAARQTHRARSRRRVREIPSSTVVALADRAAGAPRDDAAILDAALARLPVDQRAILVLHHLEGCPIAELATILDVPAGTAKSR